MDVDVVLWMSMYVNSLNFFLFNLYFFRITRFQFFQMGTL